MEEYAIDVEKEWKMFKKILVKYSNIFEKKFVDKGLFYNVYAQVCTRCFGSGLPSAGIVPMLDNINHNSVDISN
jgi:hypothetical protein